MYTYGDGDGVDSQQRFYIELDGRIETEKAWSLVSCDSQGRPGFVLVSRAVLDRCLCRQCAGNTARRGLRV